MELVTPFGATTHPRAGARILLRVRVRLVGEWGDEASSVEWRAALDDAIRWVDYCLSQLARSMRV